MHAGAVANDSGGTPEQIMAVNVLGTWHVLLAAEAAGVTRVIHFSSAQALGILEGERLPDYFPVDDDHPRRAMRPYGLSKRLSEDLCEGFTRRTGIATLSLRPVAVWDAGIYARVQERRRATPESEWEPYWEYGAFVDVRDVATAVERALEIRLSGHHRALLCAPDISASAPSLEIAARLAPGVPVRDVQLYAVDAWRALFTARPPTPCSAGGPATAGLTANHRSEARSLSATASPVCASASPVCIRRADRSARVYAIGIRRGSPCRVTACTQ